MTTAESGESKRFSGRAVIAVLYVVVVTIAGLTGFALGFIGPRGLQPVSYLGLVTFQPTPFGLAAYGALTLGTLLGVVMALVVFVSRRYPDA